MRWAALALATTSCLACVTCAGPVPATALGPPAAASTDALAAYYGSYATDDGDTVIVARLGWFYDLATSAYRTIYATSQAGHFTIGCRFRVPAPTCATLAFGHESLTITASSSKRTARRIAYRTTDVAIPARDATLAGTITEPAGAGPHPGIVIVHGAEPGQRYFYDIWVGLYASLGLTVLTYDKRGIGASTGTYPGGHPSDQALASYAADAAAALEFLARRPGVDPKRIGFHGGSQGGWTVPLAVQQGAPAAFAVLASAPATTVDQADQWAGFTGGGVSAPAESEAQLLAEVAGTHSGYDPLSALKGLSIPSLWLLGAHDRTVPTALSLQVLAGLHKANFTVQLLNTGHSLLVNATGLLADDDTSPGLAPEIVPAIRSWMAGSGIT